LRHDSGARLADPQQRRRRDPEPAGRQIGGEVILQGVAHAAPLVDWLFLAVTGFIAWHAIRFRDEHGDPDIVRLLFGCIAALFFFKVLFEDVLGVVRF
jgi:hypothetical protein